MRNTITGKISVFAAVLLILFVFSGCVAEEVNGHEIASAEEQEQIICMMEMSDEYLDYADWFIEFGKSYADYLYRDGDYPDSADEEIADYMECCFNEDGRAIIIANIADSYGAGHHAFLILSSDDFGENWVCSSDVYYVDTGVEQVIVKGSKVYLVFGIGARCCSYIWYSDDFGLNFTAYDGYDLAGAYSDIAEKAVFCSLRILNTDENGILVGFYIEDELYHTSDSYRTENDNKYFLIEKISSDFKTAEMLYIDENVSGME